MRGRGITYDTGFVGRAGNSRERFEPADVRTDLTAIRDDLCCTAVRVTGGDPERIDLAAGVAAELGLEVWYSPYPLDRDEDDMLALFADCADRAERVRGAGHRVVFVAGAELSLMNHGFLPGDTLEQRLAAVLRRPPNLGELVATAARRVNEFLGRAVDVVRARFGGPVSYASTPLDRVDWAPFDIVSVDLYRSAEVAAQFADGVRALVAPGKPVAITEFGCASYRGAADLGAQALDVVEYDAVSGRPLRLKRDVERDEAGQATAIVEQLAVFDESGVDAAFVFLFALEDMPFRPQSPAREDLDRASYGIVRVREGAGDGPRWERKAAFDALAEHYGQGRDGDGTMPPRNIRTASWPW
jgi:hypothetical protein